MNLHILAERFTQLSKSSYFDPAFVRFSQKTVQVIQHVLDCENEYSDETIRAFQAKLWSLLPFVRGSRSNDAPHETQFVLEKVLKKWINADILISSEAIEGFNFYLLPEDFWEFVSTDLDKFDTEGYGPKVVQIGSPVVYKHKPIFCIPLFHELGHFVDTYFGLTELSLLINQPPDPPNGVNKQQWINIHRRHRMEYFADLFASCYVGDASCKSLIAIAPNNQDSATHPSTEKRNSVVSDFLAGNKNDIIELFQATLKARGLSELKVQFITPDIKFAVDDVLTFRVDNDQFLFGLFPAAWNYLFDKIEKRDAPWINDKVSPFAIEKTVNDLVEKSIRNYEIRERWSSVSTD